MAFAYPVAAQRLPGPARLAPHRGRLPDRCEEARVRRDAVAQQAESPTTRFQRHGETHHPEHAVSGLEIYTDGACRGNPGPGGWGVLILDGRDERSLQGAEPETTNNRMELTAAIVALR